MNFEWINQTIKLFRLTFTLFDLFSFAVCLKWIKMKIMLRSFLLLHIKSRI